MDAPAWNGEPGAMPYDPEWGDRREPEYDVPVCVDCQYPVLRGGRSLPPLGVLCPSCHDSRRLIGAEFDARPIQQIRNGAA